MVDGFDGAHRYWFIIDGGRVGVHGYQPVCRIQHAVDDFAGHPCAKLLAPQGSGDCAAGDQQDGVDGGVGASLPSLLDLWRRGRDEMHSVFNAPLIAQYRALVEQLQRQPFDAVLVDVAFTGALPLLLTNRARPPLAVCGVSPLMLSSASTPPFGIGWHPWPGFDHSRMNWFIRHVLFADVQARRNAALRTVQVSRAPVFLTDWPKLADRVLQLTVPSAEHHRGDLPPSVIFAGPIFAGSDVKAATPWRSQMAKVRRVVHVTQGTWDNVDHGQLIGPTLEALAHRDDLLVIATTGLPEQAPFTGFVPENAYVTDSPRTRRCCLTST